MVRLCSEVAEADAFLDAEYSKKRHIDPQITNWPLTDAHGSYDNRIPIRASGLACIISKNLPKVAYVVGGRALTKGRPRKRGRYFRARETEPVPQSHRRGTHLEEELI